jgi:TolA-binding protein
VKKIIGRFTGTAYRGVVGTKGDIDAAILVEINNSENSGDFEHAIALYRNTIDRFPNYNQTSALILRLGYLLHRLGKFKEAEESYKYLVDKFPDSPENSIAKGLIRKIAELESEKKRSAGVISKIAVVKDKLSEQSLYYDLGLSKFSSFNLIYAKENFKKAISAIPDNTIAAKSYFYLGLCERLLGNLTESINALEEAYKLAGDNQDLKMESKYQTVQIYKQKGDYNKAAAILEEVIRDYKNKTVRPILLFQEGATLLFDLGDTAKAKQAFETLRIEYPAQTIVYPGSYFVDKYIKMDIPPKKPEEIEKIAEKTKLLDAVLPKRAIEIIQTAAKDFTAKVNNRISELILLKEKYKGVIQDEATIKIRQSLLNNYIQEWFPPGSKGKVWDISVRYDGDERITAFGAIYLEGATPMDVFISGRLKIVEWINQPYWEAGDKRSNWVIFLPTQCKIKGIPISPDLINLILKPATEEFNKNFPLQIKKFGFNKETMEFVGDVKSDIVKKFKATSYSRGSTG